MTYKYNKIKEKYNNKLEKYQQKIYVKILDVDKISFSNGKTFYGDDRKNGLIDLQNVM